MSVSEQVSRIAQTLSCVFVKRRSFLLRLGRACLCAVAFVIGFTLVHYHWVSWRGSHGCFASLEALPVRPVGLVLGTSPKLSDGRENPSFYERMNAAAAVWKAGKVERLLVSGSNDGGAYFECELMTRALMKRGVPREAIFQDNAGLRTLDSVVRAHAVYGLESFTIISQAYHNERALVIARKRGITQAIAFNADNPDGGEWVRSLLREHAARLKMSLDLYVLNTQAQSMELAPGKEGQAMQSAPKANR